MMYRMVMQDAIEQGALLPEWDRRSRMVQRVMDRLIPASGLEDQKWEVHVIESDGKCGVRVLQIYSVFRTLRVQIRLSKSPFLILKQSDWNVLF